MRTAKRNLSKEIRRILNEGGLYRFFHNPFWSCSVGHHYKHWLDNGPIPHFSHLYLSQADLRAVLESNLNVSYVDAIIQDIYENSELSRLSRAQVFDIVRRSELELLAWEDTLDPNWTKERCDLVLSNNLFDVFPTDLKIRGSSVLLKNS